MAPPRLTPLHPSLGAEVAGVDLGKPIDEATRQALSRALADHLALVFHDQSPRGMPRAPEGSRPSRHGSA
jgi:alpha-ketoglutarate-dependent taurine dioxygenase